MARTTTTTNTAPMLSPLPPATREPTQSARSGAPVQMLTAASVEPHTSAIRSNRDPVCEPAPKLTYDTVSDTVSYVKTEEARPTRAEKQARTRQALIDAGAEVFVERGFQGASIEAIAERAGFTRGAFYSNFGSKEELFAELVQQRIYSHYRELVDRGTEPGGLSLREAGAQLAKLQERGRTSWLFQLWLEMLAHAARNPATRKLAAGSWTANRRLAAAGIDAAHAAAGSTPPISSDHIATAMIALDVGLALQHLVDPDAVPLDLYPELFEALFESLAP